MPKRVRIFSQNPGLLCLHRSIRCANPPMTRCTAAGFVIAFISISPRRSTFRGWRLMRGCPSPIAAACLSGIPEFPSFNTSAYFCQRIYSERQVRPEAGGPYGGDGELRALLPLKYRSNSRPPNSKSFPSPSWTALSAPPLRLPPTLPIPIRQKGT